jgi:hypothetical protein
MRFWKALLGKKRKGLDMMEIDKQAKMILVGGEALTHEIEAAILDIVISNAAGIEKFHERREELTEIDYEYLFFYAVSLILFFTSGPKSWTEENINSIIDKAAEEIVRMMRFRSAGQGDPKSERSAIVTQLRRMFENVRSNFSRFEEIGEVKERDDAFFTLMLMYLRKVYPTSLTFILEGNTALLDLLLRSFGLISISAHRYVSD